MERDLEINIHMPDTNDVASDFVVRAVGNAVLNILRSKGLADENDVLVELGAVATNLRESAAEHEDPGVKGVLERAAHNLDLIVRTQTDDEA